MIAAARFEEHWNLRSHVMCGERSLHEIVAMYTRRSGMTHCRHALSELELPEIDDPVRVLIEPRNESRRICARWKGAAGSANVRTASEHFRTRIGQAPVDVADMARTGATHWLTQVTRTLEPQAVGMIVADFGVMPSPTGASHTDQMAVICQNC